MTSLTFEDDYADAIVAIHLFEHLYRWEAEAALIEWKRVLRDGGELILEMPCMNKVFNYIRLALNAGEPLMPWCTWNALYGDPQYKSIPMTHKWGYTKEMIEELLLSVGFKNIRFEEPNYHFPIRDMRVVAIK